MDSTKIGGLSKDSWECSGIVQPFCNPQDCERLRQIWELTQNPAALCQDCKKMVQSTIPAEHSAKWLRISVEFRNGPAIHTIFMQCFQSSCNPFHTCNSDAIQIYCARHSRIVCQLWIDSKMTWIRCEKSCFLRLVCNPRNFYAMLSINLQSFIDSQSWCNSN